MLRASHPMTVRAGRPAHKTVLKGPPPRQLTRPTGSDGSPASRPCRSAIVARPAAAQAAERRVCATNSPWHRFVAQTSKPTLRSSAEIQPNQGRSPPITPAYKRNLALLDSSRRLLPQPGFLSGRRVQVGFPMRFSALLRSFCGPNSAVHATGCVGPLDRRVLWRCCAILHALQTSPSGGSRYL